VAWAAAPLEASIGSLTEPERPDAADVLARAFRDNPLNVAVIGDEPERRLRSNVYGARTLLPVAEAHGEVWVARAAGRVVGTLIGTPPFAYPLPPPALGARLRCLFGQGWRVARRWAEVFEALDAVHPPEPSWYLGTLGVDPEHQGRGVGSALLRHWLSREDAEAGEGYLETDRRENVAFYERAGFCIVRDARVLGVHVWCMQRRAHSA
jgi:ribosomal protein S18 acetylase RimI-like enzyme